MAGLMRIACFIVACLLGLLVPRVVQAHDAEHDDRVVPRYPSYPYAQHTKGYVRRLPNMDAQGDEARLWSVRVAGEGGYLGRQGYRAGGRALLRYWRLGLSADAYYYNGWGEQRPFYLGGANATVDLIMRPHFGLRVGPGVLARVEGEHSVGELPAYEIGPNFSTEVDIFPIHPVVASGRFDVGRLGDSTTAVSGRVSLGVMVRRLEVLLAYEVKLIGEMPLRGPQLGLRAWF